jgi:uncharacterized protein YcfL
MVVALVALAGCSSGDDDDASSQQETTADASTPSTATTATTATSAPTTTATTVPLTPEGQVAADYLAYWQAYDQLAQDPGGSTDALAEHASGQALDSAQQAIGELRSQNQSTELGPLEQHNAYSPSIIDDRTAYVADCHVSDARVVDAGGGVVRGDPPDGRPETIAVNLVRGTDRWLVDSLQYYDLAPGETCSENGPTAG